MPAFRALKKEGLFNVSALVVFVSFLLLEEQAFPRFFSFIDITPNHVPGTGSIGIINMVLALKKLVVRWERRVVQWMLRESLRFGASGLD